MKKRVGSIITVVFCMMVSFAAAQNMSFAIDEKANRVIGHFSGPVVEALYVDMPIPREIPEEVTCKVKDIRITQKALEKALSGLIYDDHLRDFNIDPASAWSNYVYEDAAIPAGYEYDGEPFISDRVDKTAEIAQAQQITATLLNRLAIDYMEPFYFVGRKEDFFSKRYPLSQEEAGQWERGGSHVWENDELTLIVAQYDLGGLPQAEWFIANANTRGGYDYGGAAYIVVDDAGKIVFAKIFSPRQYVESLADQTEVIPWQEALEAFISYRTQTPFPAKSIRNWTGTLVYMELCVFADQNGRTYPVWKLIEDRFYDYTDFKGNPMTCGGMSCLYVDAISGIVMP